MKLPVLRASLVFLLLTMLSPAAPAQDKADAKKNAGAKAAAARVPEGVRVLKDLVYVPGGHERQKLDLHLPERGGRWPLVVWVHGGGWQNGSKENCPAIRLTGEGFAVASINYRLSSHALWPAQIQDCQAAIRWLRANAAKHGYDPDRIGVWGSSAGGHLVTMLGVASDVPEFEAGGHAGVSGRVQAVCDWFGPTDFLQMNQPGGKMNHDAPGSPESKLIGGPIQENKAKVARANPLTFVTADDAPFLIMHGEVDPLVPYQQSELLEAALKRVGVPVVLVQIAGAGHGGAQFQTPESQARVLAFFTDRLKPPAKSGAIPTR